MGIEVERVTARRNVHHLLLAFVGNLLEEFAWCSWVRDLLLSVAVSTPFLSLADIGINQWGNYLPCDLCCRNSNNIPPLQVVRSVVWDMVVLG